MTVILHPPGDVSFSGDAVSAEDQARIARAVREAVMRAVENAAGARHCGVERTGGRPGNAAATHRSGPAKGSGRGRG